MSDTTSIDAAAAAVEALLAQIETSNVRAVQAQDIGTADNYVFAPTPAVANYGPDLLVLVDISNPNLTATPKLNVSGFGSLNITAASGGAVGKGAVAGKCLFGLSSASGGGFVARLLNSTALSSVRQVLSSALTIYIRTDGSDTNNSVIAGGVSTNTSAGAFATLQAAWNFVSQSYDLAGQSVTLQLGIPGTYAGVCINNTGVAGNVIINGAAGAAAANYILTPISIYPGVAPACIRSEISAVIPQNLTCDISSVPNGMGVFPLWAAGTNAFILIGPNVTLQTSTTNTGATFLYGNNGGLTLIETGTTLTVKGPNGGATVAALAGVDAAVFGGGTGVGTATINVSNLTWAYGGAFANQGTVAFFQTVLTSSNVSGPRYNVGPVGLVQTYGGGANFIPGSSAGSSDATGAYR